jgi:hypothetical protein
MRHGTLIRNSCPCPIIRIVAESCGHVDHARWAAPLFLPADGNNIDEENNTARRFVRSATRHELRGAIVLALKPAMSQFRRATGHLRQATNPVPNRKSSILSLPNFVQAYFYASTPFSV